MDPLVGLGSVNPLRQSIFQSNFFDLQARAMFHGHLSMPNGTLGIEGFVHDGKTYTYFGLFPSIIRMPILLVTSSLDGKLTPSYVLLGMVFDRLVRFAPALASSLLRSRQLPPWGKPRPLRTGS